MSAESNKQLVMRGYAMFKNRNIQAILDICADTIEWTSLESEHVPFSGTFHGKDGLADYFRKLDQAVEFLSFEPQTFIAEGDTVMVCGRLRGQVRANGATYDDKWVHVFTVENDKLTRMQQYHDTAAIEAAFMPTAASGTQPESRIRH